jgi:hypothetical protein
MQTESTSAGYTGHTVMLSGIPLGNVVTDEPQKPLRESIRPRGEREKHRLVAAPRSQLPTSFLIKSKNDLTETPGEPPRSLP